MEPRSIRPTAGPLDAVVAVRPSKSVTHRALVAAGLARGASRLRQPLESDDTAVTLNGLRALGVEIRTVADGLEVHGSGGNLAGGASVDLGDSGTSLRLLVAVASLCRRASRFDGSARLRERPIDGLVAALESIGARVRAEGRPGALPLVIGGAVPEGGFARLAAAPSSQFASALLLCGPLWPRGLELELAPPLVSRPYVDLTCSVMRAFGARVEHTAPTRLRVAAGGYGARDYAVEGDHSSASYFLAAAALVGGRVRVEGLDRASRQPDARLGGLLKHMGCHVAHGPGWIEVQGTGRIPAFELDLCDAPDLVPTLAALALFAEGPCRMTGIGHLRLKESDRLAVLARELSALGRASRAVDDGLIVGPPEQLSGRSVDPDADHRVAMAFAVAGLRLPGVAVRQPGCVAKSNPEFWSQFACLEGPVRN